ncbi:rhomboid-like protein [Streptomyces sp. NPDC059378]|uniref:rhomboid-like protein n=1 Tax=Streptomyces sp. NPDC059378 TaxID=3346815 RepID=UPI00368097B3
MERTATAASPADPDDSLPNTPDADAAAPGPALADTDTSALLGGMPRQWIPAVATTSETPYAAAPEARPAAGPARGLAGPAGSAAGPARGLASGPAAGARLRLRLRPWRLLPTPTGTPFAFAFTAVLAVTSLITSYADPVLVHTLHQGSSTDVAHLVRTPVLVLLASALWIAGGVLSVYAICCLLVLTALERRIGGLRTAGVFLLGHVTATLATEVPVGLAVLAGRLPASSLHRLDYGISFGVAAGVGALTGLLAPWLGRPLLVVFAAMLVRDLIGFADPMTNWGHLMSLAVGCATWPVTRRWHRGRAATAAAR